MVSTISVVSAGWFDFLGGESNEPKIGEIVYIHCYPYYSGNEYSVYVHGGWLNANDLNLTEKWLENKYMQVNLTDENGQIIESRNISFEDFFDGSHVVKTTDGDAFEVAYWIYADYFKVSGPGTYVVSFYYPGDENITEFKYNETVNVTESLKDTYESQQASDSSANSDPSTEVVSTETTQEGGLTRTTTTYADGHTRTVESGVVYK